MALYGPGTPRRKTGRVFKKKFALSKSLFDMTFLTQPISTPPDPRMSATLAHEREHLKIFLPEQKTGKIPNIYLVFPPTSHP
jgi:hypothetical protein